MPIDLPLLSSPEKRAGAAGFILAGVIVAMLLLLLCPQKAQAQTINQVRCSPAANLSIDFGTALTASAQFHYTCSNDGNTPVTFNICMGNGNSPSYPGTTSQPLLLHNNYLNTLRFNIYTDPPPHPSAVWTYTNPVRQSITVPPGNNSYSGSMTFYGQIDANQVAPTGNYAASFYQTVLGYVPTGSSICQAGVGYWNGTLQVNATFAEACTLGTISAVDFGVYNRHEHHVDATGAVVVDCPLNQQWTLSFDGGNNALNGERRMTNGDGDYIAYHLYSDAGRNTEIPINGTITGTGTGTNQAVPVHGRVETPTLPPIGTYIDFVIVVLSF